MPVSRIKIWLFFLAVFFILLNSLNSIAQESIDVSYNYGTVAIHSPEIEALSENPVNGIGIAYTFKNKLGEHWRPYYNYPNFGLIYNYKTYNYPDVLGDAHSVTGFLQFPFLPKRKYFDIGCKALTGLGYITKIYDEELNPTNKAISSHLNISAEVRFYGKIRLKPVFLEYSYGLSHISNGLMKAPNLGINVFNHGFSLGYEFEDQPEIKRPEKQSRAPFIKNEFWAFASTGFKETEFDEKKYTFTGISFNYSKQISVINKMGLGVDFSKDPSLTSFARNTYHYEGTEDLSFRWGINLHNEFMMGKVGIYMAYGLYMGNQDYYTRQRYYKAGLKFYFKNIIGLTHIRAIPLFRAEVIEFGIGYRITDKRFRAYSK